MKNKPNKKQHHKQKPTHETKSKRQWAIVVAVIVGATLGIIFWKSNQTTTESTTTSTSSSVTANAKADKDQLTGRWTRTDSDGAYVIEIKSAGADGKLDASYFNPNPIKVGHAGWQNKNGNLIVLVELRDVNYPGSTYTLNFLPAENRMTGNYYQAVEGANFDVEFIRAK